MLLPSKDCVQPIPVHVGWAVSEDDSTTFNLVYEWMVNENMFNDFIPMKDGKQVILPSFPASVQRHSGQELGAVLAAGS